MSQNPKLSVAMITYNHAQFIAKALDSVLMQRVCFDYEIVIGDDCSTDRTVELIRTYQQRGQDKLRPAFREKNIGMQNNFRETLEKCRGEYIALLEGDDYWTDPDKLQTQVNYLDSHPECALSHHRVEYVTFPGGQITQEFPPLRYRVERSGPQDLSMFNYIQTCSVVFRRKWLPAFDKQFAELKLGDWPLFVLLSQQGWIGYLDRTMAHYRFHPNNTWNNRPADYRIRAMESMAWYLLERVDDSSRDLWRDTIIALAFKDLALSAASLSPARVLNRLSRFLTVSWKLRRPLWVLSKLWPYYKAHYLKNRARA